MTNRGTNKNYLNSSMIKMMATMWILEGMILSSFLILLTCMQEDGTVLIFKPIL